MDDSQLDLIGYPFFEHSPQFVVVLDPDGKILEVNPAAITGYGYEKDELLLLNIFDLCPISTHSGVIEQLKDAENNGIFVETVHLSREGRIFPVEMYLQPFNNKNRLLLLATISDTSRWREVNRKKRRLTWLNKMFTNIFMNLSDGAIIVDTEGRINEANLAAERMLGQKAAELQGKAIGELLGIKTPYTNEMLMRGKPYSDLEIIVDQNNHSLHFMLSGNPVTDENGNINGGVLFFRPFENVHHLVQRLSGSRATYQFDDIITCSDNVLEVIRIASQAAQSTSSILLEGESGTGKEVFAQAIHNLCQRSSGPFIAVNCGAIPRELVGSELFGYTEGAFTGARKGGSPGKFELAHGGTLFLDEIGDMPLEQQVALLRVLQEKKVTRIGGNKVIPVDVRVICATNKNLWGEVEAGNFRADLYYRLNVISIQIPPLRSRLEDIPLLFEYFLDKIQMRTGKSISHDRHSIMKYLQKYDWPGNVRELENVVERMVNIANGSSLGIEHLPPEIRKPNLSENQEIMPRAEQNGITIYEARMNDRQVRSEEERQRIIELLHKHRGNVSKVAREMGLDRSTIYRKMRNYQINPS